MQKVGSKVPLVVFDGSKCFWRTKNTVDLLFVEHEEHNVVEIIAYEPTFCKESPRIYLDKSVLILKIDSNFVDQRLRFAKEQCLRRHQVPDVLNLLHEINLKARVDYILNRLFITELIPETKTMTLGFQFNFRDRDEEQECSDSLDKMIIARPPGLVPHVSPHQQPMMADTVNELLQAIEDDKESLRQLSSTAEVHEVNARSLLGIRERWRMPIVMKKVANGRRLNVGDAKIWKVVSKRLCIDESVNASEVIERALVAPIKQSVEAGSGVDNAKPCKSVAAAGAAAKNAAVVSLFFKSAFPKPARRSMVPAALFSHSGNAAIIKEGAAPAEANQQTLKTAVSQRSTSPQPSKKTEEGNGSVSVGFSAVSTSFKKRMGMNKAATASRLQGGTALSAVAEHDEYSHGRYGTSSHRPGPTAKILRSATASTATASCSSETSKVTTSAAPIAPIAAVSKPAVPKVVVAVSSRKVCPIATDIPEQEAVSTKMPTPQLSDRIAAGLSSLTESIRRSFSFKMQSSGAGADVSTKAGTLKVDESASEEVSGFSQKGDFSDRMADVSDTEKSPLLTSRPSSQDLEAAAPAQVAVPEPLSQEVFSSFNSCPGTAAATKEHGKDVGAPMPQKVAAPHRRGHFAASEADDSVTPKTLEMYKNKQAAAKHSKGSPTPSASIPLQPPAKAVKGWLSWSSQKKVAKQVEASTDCASPRTDKSTAAAAASQATPENSQRTTPRAASLSRAAVSYQELVEKRQQLQTERSVRALGTKGGTGRLAPATAMRQIWSSLLGSEKKKITPAE